MRTLLLTPLIAFAACGGSTGETVPLLDYEVEVPPGFEARTPSSSMRLAEYTVLGEGPEPAEVVVYYFGEGQGGSADANIARWNSQFSSPDGTAVTPRVMTAEGTAFPTTIAEFEGTYARTVGMGGSDQARADQALVAGVVETPRGNLFFQLFGNREAVAAARGDFLAMITSIRAGRGAGPVT